MTRPLDTSRENTWKRLILEILLGHCVECTAGRLKEYRYRLVAL